MASIKRVSSPGDRSTASGLVVCVCKQRPRLLDMTIWKKNRPGNSRVCTPYCPMVSHIECPQCWAFTPIHQYHSFLPPRSPFLELSGCPLFYP
ncbi:hypothetical protein RRG08_003106 [Elysia crispata]|uniref:Uncharacterized protein n=1 Tax=Elysia crispata TaxID=231223 RepID=A0AAE1EBM8_9GAST|nr:hypothetical protein RRG08_003106 [Elysia crispata]